MSRGSAARAPYLAGAQQRGLRTWPGLSSASSVPGRGSAARAPYLAGAQQRGLRTWPGLSSAGSVPGRGSAARAPYLAGAQQRGLRTWPGLSSAGSVPGRGRHDAAVVGTLAVGRVVLQTEVVAHLVCYRRRQQRHLVGGAGN